jgi:hypothetical protein
VAGGALNITADIDGVSVSRDRVLAWEEQRARKVCGKLGVEPSGDLAQMREALVARKLELGQRALEELLARELRLSEWAGRFMAAVSGSRRRLCSVELHGVGVGSAEAMPRYYQGAMESGDEVALLSACPDHYILREAGGGLQQVIETTGGSPLAARIILDESDLGTVTTEADPTFPVQWVAVGRSRPGSPAAGAIRHQFRDEQDGFTVRLTGEFPIATPPFLIRAHKWHLACEFSNWIEAANA